MNRYAVPYSSRGSIFGEEEIGALTEFLRSDETLACGEQREAFEAEFAEHLGVRHAVSVTNCTEALELATYSLHLQPGDVVIVTPQTFQATINPLLDCDVEVRFCDVDPNSLCIDPNRVEKLLCARTKALYLTHFGGLMADMDRLIAMTSQRGIRVIEDCAHAHGSEYKGKRAGTLGDLGCYSFQSMKNMSTLGTGGMLTFNDSRYLDLFLRLRACEPDADFVKREEGLTFGRYAPPRVEMNRHQKNAYSHDCSVVRRRGAMATLSEAAALVGRIQLRRLPDFIARRREIAARLNNAIGQIPGLRVQIEPEGYVHSYHLYTFFVEPNSGIDHETLLGEINAAGVEIVLRYFPLHLLPEWRLRGGQYSQCPVAEKIWF